MLSELHIENIAVIERADLSFGPGLNVLTGETGAGKSIVIDSIGAVLGDRVSRELVRRGADKGTVTAVFHTDGCENWLQNNEIEAEDELILQRRILADGKSSCRICGTPVTAAQMKELAALLVDIHGQNDGRLLLDENRHQDYLDRFGIDTAILQDYRNAYQTYRQIKKEITALEMDEIEKERLSDSLRFQIEELDRAQLKSGEYDSICARRDLLHNSEKLTEALDEALLLLSGGDENAISMVQNASYYVSRASAFAGEIEAAGESIHNAAFLLSDASERLRDLRESLDFSPEEYNGLETRISFLSRLQRKYNRDEDGLIAYLAECSEKLDNIRYSEERMARLQKKQADAETLCRELAGTLSRARQVAAERLGRRISDELCALSMPSVQFSVEFVPVEGEPGFDANGCDRIRFLMSANAGEEPGRISHIASGGELSRIMLAMKNVFAEKDPVPTMIFDEIDTGISGIAAQRVGEKLYTVSLGKQVLCVTHLAQIAAMADHHYLIKKEERNDRTYTDVIPLGQEGRRQELARLHGGDNITVTTLASAEEQLQACEAFKKKTTKEKRT